MVKKVKIVSTSLNAPMPEQLNKKNSDGPSKIFSTHCATATTNSQLQQTVYNFTTSCKQSGSAVRTYLGPYLRIHVDERDRGTRWLATQASYYLAYNEHKNNKVA